MKIVNFIMIVMVNGSILKISDFKSRFNKTQENKRFYN